MQRIALRTSIVGGAVLLCTYGFASANLINPDFESGLTGWASRGLATAETAAFGVGPVIGAGQALLRSGAPGTVSAAELAGFLGVTTATLSGLGSGTPEGGSGLMQTFSATAGNRISFNWNFLTNEGAGSAFNDFAFFVLTPPGGPPTVGVLADTTFPSFVPSPPLTPFVVETGFQANAFVAAATGTYGLGFGIVDVGDRDVDSALLIDNVGVVSGVVPEPTTLALLGSGLLGLGGMAWRRARKASPEAPTSV